MDLINVPRTPAGWELWLGYLVYFDENVELLITETEYISITRENWAALFFMTDLAKIVNALWEALGVTDLSKVSLNMQDAITRAAEYAKSRKDPWTYPCPICDGLMTTLPDDCFGKGAVSENIQSNLKGTQVTIEMYVHFRATFRRAVRLGVLGNNASDVIKNLIVCCREMNYGIKDDGADADPTGPFHDKVFVNMVWFSKEGWKRANDEEATQTVEGMAKVLILDLFSTFQPEIFRNPHSKPMLTNYQFITVLQSIKQRFAAFPWDGIVVAVKRLLDEKLQWFDIDAQAQQGRWVWMEDDQTTTQLTLCATAAEETQDMDASEEDAAAGDDEHRASGLIPPVDDPVVAEKNKKNGELKALFAHLILLAAAAGADRPQPNNDTVKVQLDESRTSVKVEDVVQLTLLEWNEARAVLAKVMSLRIKYHDNEDKFVSNKNKIVKKAGLILLRDYFGDFLSEYQVKNTKPKPKPKSRRKENKRRNEKSKNNKQPKKAQEIMKKTELSKKTTIPPVIVATIIKSLRLLEQEAKNLTSDDECLEMYDNRIITLREEMSRSEYSSVRKSVFIDGRNRAK